MLRSRREFVKMSSVAAAAAGMGMVWPRHLRADLVNAQQTPGAWAPTVRSMLGPNDLAAAALEAAKSAGAVYADVNIFLTQREDWVFSGKPYYWQINQEDPIGIGVRALYNGYWGFSGSDGFPTTDVAAALGRDAASQAKNAAKGRPRTVDLGTIPAAQGTWTTPFEIDPFTVSFEEKADYGASVNDFAERQGIQISEIARSFSFTKEERIFASTEGAATSQNIYAASQHIGLYMLPDWMQELPGRAAPNFTYLSGGGWEYIRNAPIKDHVQELIDFASRERRPQPFDIGRYDVVFDANAMAAIVGASVSGATQLDRAMGYQANTVGTSFLNDPLGMLGKYQIGSPLLTLKANRSMRAGAATVKWDCEGVEPHETTLIKEGILTDFQTTRESSAWLAPYYQAHNTPVQSNGCSGTDDKPSVPIGQIVPNLVMQPGSHEASFEDLVKDTKKGLAVIGLWGADSDFQSLNGTINPRVTRVINNGVLGDVLRGPQLEFRTPEFWKNLVAVGGEKSARTYGQLKGWERYTGYSVSAVPAKIKSVALIDPSRKA